MKQQFLKINILLLFLIILSAVTLAQERLYVHPVDGKQQSYALSVIRKLTFPAEKMVLDFNNGSSGSYALADIQYCNFRYIPDRPQNGEQWITFNIYPIPTENKLIVECSEDMNEISLYDITGRRVLIVFPKNRNTILELGNFSSGVYILQLFTSRGMRLKDIIKI